MNWFEGRGQEPKDTCLQLNKSLWQYHIMVKIPLNHPALLLLVLHPHHYKSYLGSAFTLTVTCLWRSGLVLTGFFHLELSHLLFAVRECVIVALTCAVLGLHCSSFGL